jgi:hypothetical protein
MNQVFFLRGFVAAVGLSFDICLTGFQAAGGFCRLDHFMPSARQRSRHWT